MLVTEISTDKKYFVGHNKFYEQVSDGLQWDSTASISAPPLTSVSITRS